MYADRAAAGRAEPGAGCGVDVQAAAGEIDVTAIVVIKVQQPMLALVLSVFVPPLKFTVPELVPLFVTSTPSQVDVHERLPEIVAVPVS